MNTYFKKHEKYINCYQWEIFSDMNIDCIIGLSTIVWKLPIDITIEVKKFKCIIVIDYKAVAK